MDTWTPKGPLLNFLAATTAPTSVQCIALSGEQCQQLKVDNTSTSVDVVLGWDTTDAEAKANASAAANVNKCAMIQHGTIQIITVGPNMYVTGKTASSTATVYVQVGVGE